jgi:hypothetical protein
MLDPNWDKLLINAEVLTMCVIVMPERLPGNRAQRCQGRYVPWHFTASSSDVTRLSVLKCSLPNSLGLLHQLNLAAFQDSKKRGPDSLEEAVGQRAESQAGRNAISSPGEDRDPAK